MENITYTKIDDFMTPTKKQWQKTLEGLVFTPEQREQAENAIYKATGIKVNVVNPKRLKYASGVQEIKIVEFSEKSKQGWDAWEKEASTWYSETMTPVDNRLVDEYFNYLKGP